MIDARARTAALGLTAALAAVLATACGNPAPAMPDGGTPIEPTYENVAMIMQVSCAFASCHGGAGAGASMLNLARPIADGTLREALVDVPSCQYDLMPLVDPGSPETSWLFLKVGGPHTGTTIDFTPDPAWDPGITPGADGRYPASLCPLTQAGRISFGTIMPQGSMGLDAARTETLRAWIAAGAPGPS